MKPKTEKKQKHRELLEAALPRFEQFIENRESYIRELEKTVESLKRDLNMQDSTNQAIKKSIDELVAMQRLSNIISISLEPERIVSMLIQLTKEVVPVIESNIFLLAQNSGPLEPLSQKGSSSLTTEARELVQSGIIDWVFMERKTIIIPDLDHVVHGSTLRNFVIVPLMLDNKGIGIYLIHTEKPQQDFSNQDIQLLTVLANQAAAGVESWRTHQQLVKIYEELQSSQAQTIQAAKLAALGELAANVLHEIKNPLQVLMLQLDCARMGRIGPQWVDKMADQIKRLSDISMRLMNFCRNAADGFDAVPVSINKAVQEMVAIVGQEFRNASIGIETVLAENLPVITGNNNYLQQVFLNLLINARDAMPKGGKITVSTRVMGTDIHVSFSDTGTGIKKENLTKIFQPFFTTKALGKGTGLGLSVSNKIVGQHGGTISVESEEGKGTTFTIILPSRSTAK